MPLYEYECASCRNHFEIRQRVTEDSITVCPSCGGSTRRVIHPVGIIFKGSGWYSTDSRKTDNASTPSASEKPGEKPSEKAADNKPSDGQKDTSTSSSTSSRTESTKPAASSTT